MYRLLLSGHKPTFELFSFAPSTNASESKLEKISDSPAPPSATWLENSPIHSDVVYASSETVSKIYSMVVRDNKVEVVSERESGVNWPVHLHITKDGKTLITGGLGSGETVLIPLEPSGALLQTQESTPLLTYPESYPYTISEQKQGSGPEVKDKQIGEKAKYPTRQQGPHVHGVTTDSRGRVYICDLGSDATWVAEPDGDGLKVVGKMERIRGDTPRHALVSDDDQYLYVNSELQSELLIYSTSTSKLLSRTDITPPHFSPSHKRALLSADIYIHPIHRSTLYISNRGARRFTRSDPELGFGPEEGNGEGDTITIILLSPTSEVERLVYVETGLDWIRGMRVSVDGRFLACCGEVGGGLEVYEIGGEKGEILKLVAKDEDVRDVNCILWV